MDDDAFSDPSWVEDFLIEMDNAVAGEPDTAVPADVAVWLARSRIFIVILTGGLGAGLEAVKANQEKVAFMLGDTEAFLDRGARIGLIFASRNDRPAEPAPDEPGEKARRRKVREAMDRQEVRASRLIAMALATMQPRCDRRPLQVTEADRILLEHLGATPDERRLYRLPRCEVLRRLLRGVNAEHLNLN